MRRFPFIIIIIIIIMVVALLLNPLYIQSRAKLAARVEGRDVMLGVKSTYSYESWYA